MCYVHNQWYDISCATLYNHYMNALNRLLSVAPKCYLNITPDWFEWFSEAVRSPMKAINISLYRSNLFCSQMR